MKLSIIGTGYVGLVTGACLAEKGHHVTCVDISEDRVASLNQARSPIFENGLDELLRKHVPTNLSATTALADAVVSSDLTMIAVGTPFDGNAIDLSSVITASRAIGAALKRKKTRHVVVVKSTVVPGTTETVVRPALEESSGLRAGVDFGLGMNPEFLSEGDAVRDFLYPDRIVLGCVDAYTHDRLSEVYAAFDDTVPRLHTTPRTAEMIKYASNALLANLISFSNEIANLGTAIGRIDNVEVMRGVHLSQYFRGRTAGGLPPIIDFLRAGCGFGGSCLPKDVSALAAQGRGLGVAMPILEAVLAVNLRQPERVVDLLRKHYPSLTGVRVAVLGLAFKPGTSDVRESPAFPILRTLAEGGASISAHDPVATDEAARVYRHDCLSYCTSLEAALAGVDAVIVVTPWDVYDDLPGRLTGRNVVVVDARRRFPTDSFQKYEGIGL
jgi:UDPglucose 6-dehydrogenase